MIEIVKTLAIGCLLAATVLVLFAVLTKHPLWPRFTIALILLTLCAGCVGVALHLFESAR